LVKALSTLKVKNFWWLFLIVSLLLSLVPEALIASPETAKVAVVVVMDYCSIDELCALSDSEKILKGTSGAIVSFRSGAPLKDTEVVHIYASLGAGDRIYLPKDIGCKIGNVRETALPEELSFDDYYRRLNGHEVEQEIVYPQISAARNYLESMESTGLGLLGSVLKSHGILRFAFGNADSNLEDLDRSFALMLIDSEGGIDRGDVSSEILDFNDELVYGLECDYSKFKGKVYQAIRELQATRRSGIVLVYPGDLNRLERFARFYSKERYFHLKNVLIRRHLEFFGEIGDLLRPSDLLVLMSVSPSSDQMKLGSVTGFIFIKGGSYSGGKLLTSDTTRKPGRLFLSDISCTLANYFGAKSTGFKGNLIKETQEPLSFERLNRLNDVLFNIDKIRAPLIKFYVFIIVTALVISMLALFTSFPLAFERVAVSLIYLAVTMPLFFLIFGPLIALRSATFTFLTLLLNFVLVYLLLKIGRRPTWVISLFLLLLTGIIAIDAPFSVLNSYSILGYSFNTGARFYGIGNEHMGFYAAGVFLVLALIGDFYLKFSKKRKSLSFLLFYVAVLIAGFLWIMLPFAGANVGGSIAVLFGSIFTSYHALVRRLDRKLFAYSLAALVVLMFVVFFISRAFPAFHLSKFVRTLILSDYQSALTIIYRKAKLNLELLWFTVWNKYLIALLTSLIVLSTNPGGILSRFFKKDTWGESLLAGTAFGALAAFIFNDSGVVAAATLLVYPMMIFIAELLELKYENLT
jgi:MFS family permease